jgi:hypothetical protein
VFDFDGYPGRNNHLCGLGLRELARRMPRNDGHNPEHPRRHHKAMHSGRRGHGHDSKLREHKRIFGSRRPLCPYCGWPTDDKARHLRKAH